MSRLFEPGKPRYDWVPVSEDLPPDDPKNPGQSIPVLVKVFGMSWYITEAYYCEYTDKWYTTRSGTIIGSKRNKTGLRPRVVYWTSDY